MQKGLKYLLRNALFALDMLGLNFSVFLLLLFYQRSLAKLDFAPYTQFWLMMNLAWFIICVAVGLYGSMLVLKFELFVKRTAQMYLLWVMLMLFYLVVIREVDFSRTFILVLLICFSLMLGLNRFLYFALLKFIKSRGTYVNKIIIVGYNEMAKKLARYFEEEGINTELLGFVEESVNVHELTNYPVLTGINNTIELAKEMQVQEIFSTIMPEQNALIYHLMNDAENSCVRFKIIPDFSMFLKKPVVVDYLSDMPVLALRGDPLEDMGNRIKKRTLDLLVSSAVMILILSWLIPLIAILIKLESKGPVFFKQLRSGKNDQPFYCLKFRSMRMNDTSDLQSATRHDPRITSIGRFLRKSSLDEFPQFINVFFGEMSLVGPRPHMLKHSTEFSKMVAHYMSRQFLKPGITGWAQINSFRGEIKSQAEIEGRVAGDLWYFENWTIWLDIRIMFLTIYQVFAGHKNAY
jgi:putative colanic acid biosynthesis UDP-glucose lipid carrier transferase